MQGWPGALRDKAFDAPEDRLRSALEQIDTLAARNRQLKQQVFGLAREIEKARAFAYHDLLTGLPNRRLLLDSFRQASALAHREKRRLALMFLDLDGFKFVNDQFGHVAGDTILKEVARRLKACVRDGETACRFGGDEFVVLLEGCKGRKDAWVAAKRISTQLSEPYVLDAVTIEITASTGMAIFPDDGRECGDLIEVADVSMFGQKRCRLGLPKVL
jgi:diguanylate cyclase (GGDEF)-like protein